MASSIKKNPKKKIPIGELALLLLACLGAAALFGLRIINLPSFRPPAFVEPAASAPASLMLPEMETVQPVPANSKTSRLKETIRPNIQPAAEDQPEPWEQEYTVQPEDVLQITVFEEPDLTTKARVSRKGQVVFPMLGPVPVAGLTVSEVQQKLTDLLGQDYLVHPQVQVFVDKPRNVFVTGQVHKPGSYPVSTEKPTTVMEIIALAGGFTQDADLNGTRIVRTKNGKKESIRVRISDIIRKGDKQKDETVRPDDIIFVPESFF